MKMKKFTAATISEAYIKVKAELGEDALILQTRNLPASLIPFYNGDKVEVTAAIDEDNQISPAPIPQMPVNIQGNNREFLARLKTINSTDNENDEKQTAFQQDQFQIHIPNSKTPLPPQMQAADSMPPITKIPTPSSSLTPVPAVAAAPPPLPVPASVAPVVPVASSATETIKYEEPPLHIMKIRDDLSDMKKLLTEILATGESKASGGYAGPWAILYKRLVDSEIRDDFAKDLLDKLKKSTPNLGKHITKEFFRELTESFPVSACESAKIQFFVGPTGAGKTTTIAKLAAYFSLEKKKKCSLITTDTYRISAIDQLRAYSEIIGIDLQAVYSPDAIKDVIKNCKYSDVILVDSAGRSQKNREHMDELAAFMQELNPDCVHLVLSAATKESDLIAIANKYKKIGVSRMLFTKLDETLKLGNIFNVVQTVGIPVSYFTIGQSVPDDIETAQSAAFVRKLLEGSSI